ncbi:MAG: XdhC family protein [Myxococcales bacterium]|nr:XdhC family protein [Myxococcales bacterium]
MADRPSPGDRGDTARVPDCSALAVAEAVVGVLSGRAGVRGCLATVIDRSGSAPQIVGARLLLREDGVVIGTVGGGALEARVLEACHAGLRDGRSRRVTANLVRDLGMCCGGAMEVFVEYLEAAARLVLVGAGHVGQAIAPIARAAGFRVFVVDDREDMLQHPAFAEATTLDYDVDELTQAVPDLGADDYVVIATRDHRRDEQALAALLQRPHRYLGMIGSRRKVHTVLARVLARAEAAGERPSLARVRAPIGLALGGRTPAEIAVSVVAELIAERRGGDGAPMSVVGEAAERIARADAGGAGRREASG